VVHDTNMTDITDSVTPTITTTSPGWKLRLDQNGGWIGEKVLGAATTLGGRVLFTTYTPTSTPSSTNCVPNTGTNRAYAISVLDGSPVVDANADGTKTTGDRSVSVASGSIVGEVTVLLMGDGREPVNLPPESCTAGSPGCTCVAGVCTRPAPQCLVTDPNCTCPADGSPCQFTNPDVVCVAGVSAIPVCSPLNRLKKTFWLDNSAN
jgi:Tfp pilus tip-associated adhesin PilY1